MGLRDHELRDVMVGAVRERMRERGWLQSDLAYAAGMSDKHLSQLLNGRADGTFGTWQSIFDALDLAMVVTDRADSG